MFSKVEQLFEIPLMHNRYAEFLLEIICQEWQSGENQITEYFSEINSGFAYFISDEFENVRLGLVYTDVDFLIEVTDDTDGDRTSFFVFRIEENSNLFKRIPQTLIEALAGDSIKGFFP